MTFKNILVTGVAGFIGSNLVEFLLDRKYKVMGLDNFSHGFMRNIEPFLSNPNFTLHKLDVTDKKTVEKFNAKINVIVHLTAFKIPRYGDRLKTLKINTHGTENMLELARKNDAKFIFASTSDVYGKNPDLPFTEKSSFVLGNSDVKRWAYAISKIFDEHLCFGYYEEYGLPISIIRYFGGYGKNQRLDWMGGPVPVFIDACLNKKPMPIHGDGKQVRNFTYVSDQVEGTMLVIEKKEAVGEIFNISSEDETSILDLSKLIHKLCGTGKINIKFVPYETFGKYEDVRRRYPDISKAKKLLGFEPKIKLEDGLKKTIEWQRKVQNL